jgi:Kef-type K+ transport system membrane component KefB
MTETAFVPILVSTGVLVGAAILGGRLARRLHAPAVLGELIAGVLLGATVLGHGLPDVHAWLFPAAGSGAVVRQTLARMGLLVFLFYAGLELDLSFPAGRRAAIALASLFGILLPFGAGVALVLARPEPWKSPVGADTTTMALFMGAALSISALPVLARIVMDLRLSRSPIAGVMLSAAVLDDLAGWTLFGIALGRTRGGAGSGVAAAVIVFALLIASAVFGRPLARWSRPRLEALFPMPGHRIGLAVVLFFWTAAAVELAGVHALFGAFLVGLAMAERRETRSAAQEITHQLALGVLGPLYFVSVAIQVDFRAHFDLRLVAEVLAVACIGKLLGATLGARLGGLPARAALAVGAGLNARGAMEIALAAAALEAGLIANDAFVALVVMALATSMMSAPLLAYLLRSERAPEPEPA